MIVAIGRDVKTRCTWAPQGREGHDQLCQLSRNVQRASSATSSWARSAPPA